MWKVGIPYLSAEITLDQYGTAYKSDLTLASREDTLELIELSSINKVSLV